MINILSFMQKFIPNTSIATIFNISLNLARHLNTTCHHRRGSTHADTEDDNLLLFAFLSNQLSHPFTHIILFRPTIANIFSLTLPMCTRVWHQHVISHLMEHCCIRSHRILVIGKAVQQNNRLIRIFLRNIICI